VNTVYKLKKALYGLKQAPCAWYSKIEAHFFKDGFHKRKILIACLYVDDLIFTRNNTLISNNFKRFMMDDLEITDLAKMHYFLGIEVVQSSIGISISQKKYL